MMNFKKFRKRILKLYDGVEGVKYPTDEMTSMKQQELNYLRDIAERGSIDRFTTAELKVNIKTKDGK